MEWEAVNCHDWRVGGHSNRWIRAMALMGATNHGPGALDFAHDRLPH